MIESFYKGKVSETDEITKDNFRIFAGKQEIISTLSHHILISTTKSNQDLYTLKSRNIAIEALNEGINFVQPSQTKDTKATPNEEAMFPPMLAIVPSVILSSVLFSCPKIDIEAIISVLRMVDYMHDIHPDKTLQFFMDILPIVLRRLAASDESFPGKYIHTL